MNYNGENVCVVGIGARTPLGLDAHSSAAAVRAAISMLAYSDDFVDRAGEPMSVAADPLLMMNITGWERFYELLRDPMYEALSPLENGGAADVTVDLVLGLPETRPGLPANLDRKLTDAFYRAVPSVRLGQIRTIAAGHAAGLIAIEDGCRNIREGKAEFCLAGGVDSYLAPETLEWMDREGRLLSAINRAGFPPGEGAAFCLLGSPKAARIRDMEILGDIAGTATTYEENRIRTDTVCTGVGLAEAISKAAITLKSRGEKIDFTYCDLNGERYRSEEFAFAGLRNQLLFGELTDNLTPADCWGDMGAASGPLFACLAIASGQRGYAKGPRCLLWASSEGGQRCAVVLNLQIASDGGPLCPA